MSCTCPPAVPVKLTLASEDVIHSFYIPAFRLKHDVVPGSYQTYWFQATKPGRYHIFCAEYCGTNHSEHDGWVTVMDPVRYQNWLGSGASERHHGGAGREAVRKVRLRHLPHVGAAEPVPVAATMYSAIRCSLTDGRTVMADETYLPRIDSQSQRQGGPAATSHERHARVSRAKSARRVCCSLIVYIKSLSLPPAPAPIRAAAATAAKQ